MSRLKNLINELCPDGVEYKKLGELGKFLGGLNGKNKNDFKDGNAKFITYMNVFNNISLNTDITETVKISQNEKQNNIQYGDVIFTGSSETPDECGMSSVLTVHTDEKIYLNSFCFIFRFDNPDIVLPDFSKYVFRSFELRKQIVKTANGVTRFNVSKSKMSKVIIPLPPLEVQREIVEILDNFTGLISELERELELRKKQYEYYRDKFLTFDGNVPPWISDAVWRTLGEICKNICSGKNKKKCEEGLYPVYGSTGIIAYCDKTVFTNKNILLARVGANAGYVQIADGKYDVSDNTLIVSPTNEIDFKYLYFILINMNLRKYAKGGGQPLITAGQIKNIKIPVLPLSEQERIVGILDRFDKLCNDLKEGLPAEIEKRQKQYEYYRDRLLDFKCKNKEKL